MWRTASNLRRLCPQTPPAARRALQTDAAARSDRSNPALSSGHAENQQVQLRTTLKQDLWLKPPGQVSLLVQRFPTGHPHTDTVTSQQQSPGPRAPRLGGPVHTAPWKPKSLSRTMISPDNLSSRSSLALQAMPVFLCLNGRPKLLRLPKSQKKNLKKEIELRFENNLTNPYKNMRFRAQSPTDSCWKFNFQREMHCFKM